MITSLEIAHLLAKKGSQKNKLKSGFDAAILGLGVGSSSKKGKKK